MLELPGFTKKVMHVFKPDKNFPQVISKPIVPEKTFHSLPILQSNVDFWGNRMKLERKQYQETLIRVKLDPSRLLQNTWYVCLLWFITNAIKCWTVDVWISDSKFPWDTDHFDEPPKAPVHDWTCSQWISRRHKNRSNLLVEDSELYKGNLDSFLWFLPIFIIVSIHFTWILSK